MGKVFSYALGAVLLTVSQASVAFASDKACAPYEISEQRVFSFTSTAGIDANYAVQRTSEQNYEITLNLDFGKHEVTRNKVRQCYAWYNETYGHYGLTVRLYEKGDQRPAPKAVRIETLEGLERADSRNYTSSLACMTYVHEAMHIAGLADEYVESIASITHLFGTEWYNKSGVKAGKKPAFDCRPRSDSIMSDQFIFQIDASDELPKEDPVNLIYCAAPKNMSAERFAELIDKSRKEVLIQPLLECPKGTINLGMYREKDAFREVQKAVAAYREKHDDLNAEVTIEYLNRETVYKKPFYPGHIRMLLWPKCARMNLLYNHCTVNSKRTSISNGGAGCLRTSAICDRPNEWLK